MVAAPPVDVANKPDAFIFVVDTELPLANRDYQHHVKSFCKLLKEQRIFACFVNRRCLLC